MQFALTVPTVEDRLVQRAVGRIVEAVFEADLNEAAQAADAARA